MRALALALLLSLLAFLSPAAETPDDPLQPICDSTCEPNPESSTYGATFAARSGARNARGGSGMFSAMLAGTSAESRVVAGSESYSYGVPILSLPGRNGLDVNLALLYNSSVWTVDGSGITFNADRDSPGYGFRLGYGYIEGKDEDTNSYLLTEPDGSKRSLGFKEGYSNTFESRDSSYVQFVATTTSNVLHRKDGTKWTYERVGESTILRPVEIQDTNGNYISIEYKSGEGFNNQAIETITDTLGRVILFEYDSEQRLQYIKGPGPNSSTKTYATFVWDEIQLTYNFSLTVKDTVDSGTEISVLRYCIYPNGLKYEFVYGPWGIVKEIKRWSADNTLRGKIEYNYAGTTAAISDHPTFTEQTVSDGESESLTWTYATVKSNGLVSYTEVTDPSGVKSRTTLFTDGSSTGLVQWESVISGTTTPRKNEYEWQESDEGPRLIRVMSYLEDGVTFSKTEFAYTTLYGNVNEVKEYDFNGALLRKIQTDFNTSSSFVEAHILDRPTEVRVYDGTNSLKAKTTLAYDGTSPQSISPISWRSVSTPRANVTAVTRYTAPPSGGAQVRNFKYDTGGNLIEAESDCCQEIVWTYNSSNEFAYPLTVTRGSGSTTLSRSMTYELTNGLVLTTTDENEKTTEFEYDNMNRITKVIRPDNAEIVRSYDDESAQPTVVTSFPIDSTKRIKQRATFDYQGRSVKREILDASNNLISTVEIQYEDENRKILVSNPFGPGGSATLWTTKKMDALGRAVKVIPPDGSETANNSQALYSSNSVTVTDPAGKQRRMFSDALGRIIAVHEPGWSDGTPGTGYVQISGEEQHTPCFIFDDPECTQITWDHGEVSLTVDGYTASVQYGQGSTPYTIAVALANFINSSSWPVTAAATNAGGSALVELTTTRVGSVTGYSLSANSVTYDPSNFGMASFSAGASGATLTPGADGEGTSSGATASLANPMPTYNFYDVFDNLTSVTHGQQQRTFVYDGLGRLTSATTPEAGTVSLTYNDFNLVATRTDARGVVASHTYDGLNRPTQLSYNVGSTGVPSTNSVAYTYGTSPSSNNKGRLISVNNTSASESYSYDLLGRMTAVEKVVGSTTYGLNYAYNLAGEIISITYPSGRVVTNEFDSIGRFAKVTSSSTDYLTVSTSGGYNAASQLLQATLGNGVVLTLDYNDQLQVESLSYVKDTTKLIELAYSYTTSTEGNNGQIRSISDTSSATGASGRSVNYTYDAWARLKTAVTTGSTQFPQWGLRWDYDRYGNRKAQAHTAGSGVPTNSVAISASTNRITDSGYGYDSNGNMINDGLNTLTYDAENQMVTGGSGITYTYDGSGLRTKKVSGSTTTVYIFSGINVIAEYENGATVSSPTREYIYSGAQLLARIEGGTTRYVLRDHLSARVITGTDGTIVAEQGHYPFGEEWYTGSGATKFKFTSYERDGETGNDYAIFRTNINRLGRFNRPDPIGGSIADPQSLNRYAYVRNDPCNFVDPYGLTKCTISVNLNGAMLSAQSLRALNEIFAKIGVELNLRGGKDAQISANIGKNLAGTNLGEYTVGTNKVAVDTTKIGFIARTLVRYPDSKTGKPLVDYHQQRAIGVILAHEIGHASRLDHNRTEGIMRRGIDQGVDAFYESYGTRQEFTYAEAQAIKDRWCPKQKAGGSGEGIGGHLGGWGSWDDWYQGLTQGLLDWLHALEVTWEPKVNTMVHTRIVREGEKKQN